jgi:3-oxoacyl-[acyl-carrier-protein] synthase-1/3-oxoacyl-[acyl-carrier-protein] synthase II
MNKKRVAITGLGIVSPLGNDVESTWAHLIEGKSGIAPITHFDAHAFPTTIAAEVKNFQADSSTKRKLLSLYTNGEYP